ncbi:MAG: DEAD/DEAH box helicase family protein [Candidatus Pacebacteria bacterium]|nr:DEAD/DEAH box helicase family protein [Candidatus Paceibacterota bacterium]
MILKDYQIKVIEALKTFYREAEKQKSALVNIDEKMRGNFSYVDATYNALKLNFADRPKNGLGDTYPRFCIKVPTGGGKTLIAIEAIREYQNLFAKKKKGLVVWITHRETIYRQTIDNLRNKSHIYRQLLDQCSGNKTLIIEKGQPLRRQDIEDNLVVLMLMIQSAGRSTKENMKVFQDSGAYIDFFPQDNQYDEHQKLLEKIPNLDSIPDTLFNKKIIKTSLGNIIRILNPLIIVDEFHTMFSDIAKETLDGLNPSVIIGLSATPKERRYMNIFEPVITGKDLLAEDMIKLDLHLHSPTISNNWHEMINSIKKKRDALEDEALKLNANKDVYIRPIALIQAERTGKEQRGKENYVHSEDVREYLIQIGVPSYEIAVKSSELDEIKEEKLLSENCEIRYIITKEALREGWDCSFAYILGVIPSARSESSMTQLVGRILRQPYAKKTGVKELDESYVYFTSGETEDVLRNIEKGFRDEGLGDLVQNVSPESGPTGSRKIKTKIKKEIRNKYPQSLYLPVWVIKSGKKYRRFYYESDIKPKLKWEFSYAKWIKDEIFPALDKRNVAYEILVDLEKRTRQDIGEEDTGIIEIQYLSRRIADVVENAFIAYDLAQRFIKEFEKYGNRKKLTTNSGFISEEIVKKISKDKYAQEKEIFEAMVKSGELSLAVSADEDISYKLPEENDVYPDRFNRFKLNLFEDSDALSMNPLELKVAGAIDKKERVLWWVRNIAENKKWYAVRGWKKGRIRPDFIVAKKDKDNSLEMIYILESKGEHLIDNPDTQYKKGVFDRINQEKIKELDFTHLIKFKLNKEFQFELVEQGKEDLEINKFFNK